jgi:hypothetical protein
MTYVNYIHSYGIYMEFMGSITIECILIQDVNFICDYIDHFQEPEEVILLKG